MKLALTASAFSISLSFSCYIMEELVESNAQSKHSMEGSCKTLQLKPTCRRSRAWCTIPSFEQYFITTLRILSHSGAQRARQKNIHIPNLFKAHIWQGTISDINSGSGCGLSKISQALSQSKCLHGARIQPSKGFRRERERSIKQRVWNTFLDAKRQGPGTFCCIYSFFEELWFWLSNLIAICEILTLSLHLLEVQTIIVVKFLFFILCVCERETGDREKFLSSFLIFAFQHNHLQSMGLILWVCWENVYFLHNLWQFPPSPAVLQAPLKFAPGELKYPQECRRMRQVTRGGRGN